MFVQESAQIEKFFSNETLRFETVTSVDPATSEPANYGIVDKNAVLVRSMTQGTGTPSEIKYTYEHCQGACDQTPICNTKGLRRSFDSNVPQYYTGCGFSDAAADTPNTNATYYDSDGNAVACTQDCPRTIVSYDDVQRPPMTSNPVPANNNPQAELPDPRVVQGNPTDPNSLTSQQLDRSVSFMFRFVRPPINTLSHSDHGTIPTVTRVRLPYRCAAIQFHTLFAHRNGQRSIVKHKQYALRP